MRFIYVSLIFLVGCSRDVPSITDSHGQARAKVTASRSERLVQSTPSEWWQPTEVIDHGNGSLVMTWSSQAARDEYDRQQQLQEDHRIANAPDDDLYVFDDSYDEATSTCKMPRQDNGARNKLGIEKSVSTNHASLMPQFQHIAADHANRLSAFTGERLAAVQACDPHYWNVSIESVDPTDNGFSISVMAICGSRAKGCGEQILETWSYVDGELSLISRTEFVPAEINMY